MKLALRITYGISLLASIILMGISFCGDNNWFTLAGSIGASLVGAVVLAFIIDLINVFSEKKKKTDIKNTLFRFLILYLQKYLIDTEKLIKKICRIGKFEEFDVNNYEELRQFVNSILLQQVRDDRIDKELMQLDNYRNNFNAIFDGLYNEMTLILSLGIIDQETLNIMNQISGIFKYDFPKENYLLLRKDIIKLLKILTKE